jgi:hypothetical protein
MPRRGACRWTQRQRWVSLASVPLVLAHQRVHEPLPTPNPTRGTGLLRAWHSVIPAMAIGIPEQV